MFRLLTVLVAIGVAIYKTLYGHDKGKEPPATQTSQQPLETPISERLQKPEVLLGDSLTDEEWSMVQNADHKFLN